MIRKSLLALCLMFPFSAPAEEWKLAWAEEFEKPGAPESEIWGYEEGFVRNKELQYYTKDHRKNARVENGNLVLEGHHEKFPNPQFTPGSKNWITSRKEAEFTAASIITKDRKSFRYGKIEVRAKLPSGKGCWPAIWMLGTDRKGWPSCGEIDIMEFVTSEPGIVHGTLHFVEPSSGGHGRTRGINTKSDMLHSEFHVYGIEWNAQTITFFFDGKPYGSADLNVAGAGPENPFRKPFYLLVNLAIGGSWGGEADPSAYPQQFLIDWIRVWEKSPAEKI